MITRIFLDLVQGALTSLDTSMTSAIREEDKQWWDEDRKWREADMAWREMEERPTHLLDREHRLEKLKWMASDREQVAVENGRNLWLRFVEKNRRDVEEKTDQLKAIINISALFALCAVVSLTQLSIPDDPQPPLEIVGVYAMTTAVTECLMLLAMLICALLLCFIVKEGRKYVNEDAEEVFFRDCFQFWRQHQHGDRPPYPRRTFEQLWESRCESSWILAFKCCNWGVSTFFVNLGAVGWIQFSPQLSTQLSSTTTVAFSLVLWSLVQWSWRAYWKRRKRKGGALSTPFSQPYGGFSGLPYDWHVSPAQT